MPRVWVDARTAVQVVEQSRHPETALMEFVTKQLEAAGFRVRTERFPVLMVGIGERDVALRCAGLTNEVVRLLRAIDGVRRQVEQL